MIQFRRTEKAGAVVLGGVYLVSTLLCVPGIVATPRIYDSWGNFFEQFSLVTGGDRFCALVIGMVPGNALSDRPHSFGHLCRFLYPRTGDFILTLPPDLFRSGFRQVRCFGQSRRQSCSHSRL